MTTEKTNPIIRRSVRLLHALQELHKQGFHNLACICAMSPSGMDWRIALHPFQNLYFDEDGQLEIVNNDDPSINYIETISSEENTWEQIESNIRSFCDKNINKNLCVPTSGGFDSRLINFFSPRINLFE